MRLELAAEFIAVRLKPVPSAPTHCTQCGERLEPLRRYAGLCKACVAARARGAGAARSRLRGRMVIEVHLYRRRPDRRVEHYVRAVCECGRRTVIRYDKWRDAAARRCCNRCRLQEIRTHGFEAEIGR